LHVVLLALISILVAQPSEFDFTPNNTFGIVIEELQIDGAVASGEDYIAAFDVDQNCAEAVQLISYEG